MIKYLFSFLSISALAFSCKPDPVFPDEPQLTFLRYEYNGADTLEAVFSFTDGDGDIGVAALGNDSNMVLTLYYKAPDGQFHVARPGVSTTDSIYYTYRIPDLPEGQRGLEGEIYLVINPQFIIYDTIQFNAFLLDQAHNKSPLVRTPETTLD